MSAIESFHIPATHTDAQKLAENRATLWPSMLLVITYLQAWWPEGTSKPTKLRLLVEWAIPSNIMMNGMAFRIKKLAERDAAARRAGRPRPGYNYTK